MKMDHNGKTEDTSGQMLSPKRLRGKVAVITGGARGIGAATARVFAENGAHVVIADILDELGESLAESIGGRYVHCDVSKEEEVESAVQLAVEWKGRLDIIFNNAGIAGFGGSITNIKMDQMMALLAINLNGVVHGIKHAARTMIAGKHGGTIICSSSSAAIMGGLASHSYTMSKEAILGLARSTACELGVHGIRVNCISPHGVPSEMLVSEFQKFLGNTELKPDEVSSIVGKRGSLLRGRGGRLEDVAQAVLFLASDESGFITGHNLVIDGGYTSACSQMSYIYKD
ncbi:short-chain dehydrogenase reductase ATA1 [Lycium barbarum]|uniref:short-chain dehydrogenase reductase ATA1 n=1 Tax=Lycium barbarum TaxID=112863 RepID=UPI00293EFC87|nr:short-chain dehydrogenase reductase ATA1 [Lycium barbarum]